MELRRLALKAQYYAICNGILIEDSNATATARHLQPTIPPLALFPSPLPRQELTYITKIQPLVNELYDNVSRDHIFLKTTLQRVIETDQFTRQLVNILEILDTKKCIKKTACGLLRSDYMMESRSDRWNGFTKMKQVEVNTIAAATGCLAERVPQLHRFTVSLRDGFCKGNYDLELPASENGKGMAEGLATAWKEYGSDRAVIVMLMCANEWNIYDMFHLEALLLLKFCVKLIQVNFDDIVEGGLKQATLREDGALIIDGYEVAVIYFRCGYVPEHYPSQKYWDARLLLELSQCIQCPSVALQLAGTKRVQQELAAPGVLERFVRNVDSVKQLRATFLNMYLLDQTPEGNNAAAKAIANPSDYVIKPQREGGGSNIYNEDVKKTLIDLKDSTIRGSYTMQDRIHPVETTNYFLRHGHLEELKPITVINETGIFGAFVRTGDDIVLNSVPGHYMRTKEATATEGSIRLGNTAIGSPWLN